MNASKLLVKDLRDILAREGYGDIAGDRSIRKPQLVAYVEDLIEHRHAEALEINAKRDEMNAWYASHAEAPAMGAEQDAHLPVADVAGTSLGEMREVFRPAPVATPQRRAKRKITFPTVGIIKGSRVWRNRETGVEIIKGANFAEVGLYYVCVPTQDGAGRVVVTATNSFAEARRDAKRYALSMRERVAEAHAEALDEEDTRNMLRDNPRVKMIINADPRQWATSGTEYPYRGGRLSAGTADR